MRRLSPRLISAVAILCLGVWASPASAVSTFSASAIAGVSLSTSPGDSLDDLAFLGSIARYNASAQASFDNGVLVDLDDGVVEKRRKGVPTTFGAVFAGGGSLGSLLLEPVGDSIEFGPVDAVTDEAEGHGKGEFSGAGANLNLSASVDGKAFDTGDPAFGNAKVRWSFVIDFQNLSSEEMTAIWTVNHVLDAAADADPKGTAFATATFSSPGAPDVTNAAADPIPPDGAPGLSKDPPALSGTTIFNFALAAGEIKRFEFALEAQGNATVPTPASGLLLGTGLLFAVSAVRLRRRRRRLYVSGSPG